MSLILTQINKCGIVFTTDSNVTNGNSTEKGKKIFQIPHLKAALCVAGAYSVKGKALDKWMTDYIKNDKSKTLENFTKKLSGTLKYKMTPEEKNCGCIIHISGFVKIDNREHPEMWGISNVDLLANGEYSVRKKFEFSEDFWNRDWIQNNLKQQFITPGSFGYQYYINGFTAGRASFNLLTQYINNFLTNVWNSQQYKFRPPKTIKEYASLARFEMGCIALMFNLSDYSPKYIGGKIASYIIEAKDKSWFIQ